MDVTAFVAGATGYTGRALVIELRRRGVRTVAHVRPDSARLEEWRRRFDVLDADTDVTAWAGQAMRETLFRVEPDIVFALLGTTRKRERTARREGVTADYEAVDYGLTMMLMRATLAAAPRARFVYLSSAGVGPNARGAYLNARWRVEQELRESALAWTVARPSFITGPDRAEQRPLERASAAVVDAGLRAAAAMGAQQLQDRWSSLTATELARSLAAHALDPASANCVVSAEQLRKI